MYIFPCWFDIDKQNCNLDSQLITMTSTDESSMDIGGNTCVSCKNNFAWREVLGCIICRSFVCSNCVNVTGKWVHPRESCQYCIERAGEYHDLYFVCSQSCETILNHHLISC